MSSSSTSQINRLLSRPLTSDVLSDLMRYTYAELRRIAAHYFRNEAPHQTLQPTALVHEVFLRLIGHLPAGFQNRAHYFGTMARSMRQILVERSRARHTAKRGAGDTRISLDHLTLAVPEATDHVAIEEALAELRKRDPRGAEIVELRFYAGLTHQEIARLLGFSEPWVRKEWATAKAWLQQRLSALQS
jgi:RNA polymerase sigma factor (TIGR02999 family)